MFLTLIVKPEQRRQGVGGALFANLEQALPGTQARSLRAEEG